VQGDHNIADTFKGLGSGFGSVAPTLVSGFEDKSAAFSPVTAMFKITLWATRGVEACDYLG
jgi:hypothetical protein